jgi:phosphoglycerate dehydrogenase-like enzyme
MPFEFNSWERGCALLVPLPGIAADRAVAPERLHRPASLAAARSGFHAPRMAQQVSAGTIFLAVDAAAVDRGHVERIAELAPGRTIVVGGEHALACAGDEVEIVAGSPPPDVVLALPRLRWYQQWAAGADWLAERPEASERDFILTSASGIAAAVVVEQAFGYILAFTRRLREAWAQQQGGVWRKPPPDRFAELAGKTLLVVGLGAIGSRVVKVARGFDLRVLGVRRRPEIAAPGVERVAGPGELVAMLPEADVVVSALPHTRETGHFFAAEAFAAMKPGALFISVGRGKVVDEDALVAALDSGRLAGAGMDVYEREPLPAGSPLWTLDSAILTPHWGAAFPARFERTMNLFLDNLRRFVAGEPLRNLVDKRRGY